MSDRYDKARDLVIAFENASTSWLQRKMQIGYNEAAQYVEAMEAAGVVSAPDHVGRRTVLVPSAAGSNPWDANEGKYDIPSSSRIPPRVERAVTVEHREIPVSYAEADATLEVEARDDVALLADELVEKFGLIDAAGVVEAIREARSFADAAREKRPADSATAHLHEIVERAEVLFAQRDELAATIRDLFKFAKDIGFNPKAIRHCLAARQMHPELRKQQEAEQEIYRHALGIEGPDFVVPLPTPVVMAAPANRKITAQEKRAREALMLVAASRATETTGGVFDD